MLIRYQIRFIIRNRLSFMNPEQWRKIESIFQLAMELPSEERTEFIRRECKDDSELLSEIEKLIPGAATEKDFLESPAWMEHFLRQTEIKNGVDDFFGNAELETSNKIFIGRKIGVYRLTEEIGKGGMGVVYSAERADGEFRQKVAIKLIKRGMDTDFVLRRFRQERQIAAALNHPNIARLLDGGTTSDDLPYFVLEYVEGDALFKFIAEHNLKLREKLELFLKICAAVAYAHSKLIIHRDIKPGNILVGFDGEPKLLDFGIAKILNPDLIHESAMPTATQMRLMTPEYASPEQVRGIDITEASDQYSLGVLLYELLTGERPYKFSSRAPQEIARVICEEFPLAPSSKAQKKTFENEDAALLQTPDYNAKLDRVVLKALRKDSVERYQSVRAFVNDIERFLRNEPILAESFAPAENKKILQNDFNSTANWASDQRTATSPKQKSIAVLPFKILDAAANGETTGDGNFLGIGLADALITKLSNVRQFLIRPTSSILKYVDAEKDSLTAGAELRISYILDGSIIKTDARLRVSVQLLSVEEQNTVWAERFDEELTDVFTLEDKISARVVGSLVPHLTAGERRKLSKRATDLPLAYQAYLRGRFYRNMFTDESLTKALAAYQEAISYDPEYALAYAGIADYYIWVGVSGTKAPKECYPLAKAAALRAIELDDELSDAYASLSFALICGDYDWIEAEKNAVRAVELNPNYSVARIWYSYVLLTAGRFDEALAQAKMAVALDPLTYLTHHVLMLNYFMARRFDEAAAQAALNVENFPDVGMAYHVQSWVLRNFDERREESNAAMFRAKELLGDNLLTLLSQAQTLAAAGNRADAEAVLERVFDLSEHQYLSYYQVAIVYVYLQNADKAFGALEKAFDDREGWLIWLGVEPTFDSLRGDSRFRKLLKRINLPILKTIFRPE